MPGKHNASEIIGEQRKMQNGQMAVVIEYRSGHDIDVRFEDGTVVTKKYYYDFKRGLIRNPNHINSNNTYMIKSAEQSKERIGMIREMSCGMKAKIIKYVSANNIDVEFEDGTIARNKSFGNFSKGNILHPDWKKKVRLKSSLVGQRKVAKNGESYQIIKDDFERNRVVIRFDNGVEKEYNRSSILLQKALVSSRINRNKNISVGDHITDRDGKVYEIINKDGSFVDVKTEDGKILYHKYIYCIEKYSSDTIQKKALERAENVIGEKSYTSSGQECTIIGGKKLDELDVQLASGEILHGVQYYKFKNFLLSDRTNSEAIYERKNKEYIGKSILQSCNLYATCIEYHDSENILVKFEDGTVQKTNTMKFRRGAVSYNSDVQKGSLSFNEFTLLYCLREAGFKKAIKGTLKDLTGFGNMELDLYNEQHKIAIEYDGFFHKDKRQIKRDIRKDSACNANGIIIYRIREKDIPPLHDGIAIEFFLKDNHKFSPSLRETISELADNISQRTGQNIVLPDLTDLDVQFKIAHEFSKNTSYLSHIGECGYNKRGERMEIYNVTNASAVDVVFENGYTVRTTYTKFKQGNVKCKYNHFGEKGFSACGEEMTIVSKEFGQVVDVQFEDGTIVKRQYYSSFKKGQIANPNYAINRDNKYIGEIIETTCGQLAEIISTRRIQSQLRVVARFEDGTISNETSYGHFKKGYVKNPNVRKPAPESQLISAQNRGEERKAQARKKAMSEKYISKDGFPFEVIEYTNSNHVRVKFEDGFELNTSMGVIQRGKLSRYICRNSIRNTKK